MKKLWLIFALVIIVLTFLTAILIAKEPDKEELLSRIVLQRLEAWHYNPQRIDEKFSQRVFTLHLKSLDPNKRFFLQSDIEQLKQSQFKINEDLKNGTTDFYDSVWSVLQTRIEEINQFSGEILKKPFDFTVNEALETDPEKRKYPQDLQELKEDWRLYLKYQTLLSYLDLIAPDNESGVKNKEDKPINLNQPFRAEIEVQAREKVARNLKRSFERMLAEDENRLDSYLNAVTASFDPHTEYFPPQSKEDFDMSMSGTLEGIGALLREDDDYIKVDEIVPGSAAWRQKGLQAGDLILKVAQGNGEPVDVVSMPVNDVVKLIRGKKGTEVRLTVKKSDGRIVVIPIVRDVVVLEETYAKSAVIANEKSGKKYGYVYLPSFYRDFKTNSRNSADDVKAEVQKLNKEKVNGIILDLRNNPGGSLDDAVEMSGLFIREGPVVQVKDGFGRNEILKDPDPGIAYNGKLIVLVNSASASASEILAAALQDYHRAIIIGGPSTFGKGTVQTFIDLDQYIPSNFASIKPAGSLKFTIRKYYRINGGSTQWKGVAADIPLPDLYDNLGIREKNLDYSMPWDTTEAIHYQKWNHGNFNIEQLKKRSAQRVKNSKAFMLINNDIARIKQQKINSTESLKFNDFLKEQKILRDEADNLKNLPVEQPSYIKIRLPKSEKSVTGEGLQKTKDWLKQLSKDAYLNEAWHILDDIAG